MKHSLIDCGDADCFRDVHDQMQLAAQAEEEEARKAVEQAIMKLVDDSQIVSRAPKHVLVANRTLLRAIQFYLDPVMRGAGL